ncbi:MAG: hypothetical protein LBK66_06075 [Spirochaetaceae bacterium]|jgi:hypothetical protein|nr:hypothetical protein [Spirochaetaceae bacterium]
MNKIDHVIFRQLSNSQIYSCDCFKDGKFVGNMTDVGGVYLHDIKKWFEEKYPTAKIDVI